MHTPTHVIDSFPLPYCPKSCDKEKLSIPLEAHHNAQSSKIFLSFLAKNWKSCNFFIFWPIMLKLHISASEIDSFLTPYGLSNSGQEKLQFTPFCGGPQPGCSDGLCTGNIESHNFFVLGPILVKFRIRTRLIESFPTIFRTWWCSEEKLHFTPFHTLRQLKRDEARFHHLGGS